jgi:hypothetical protein
MVIFHSFLYVYQRVRETSATRGGAAVGFCVGTCRATAGDKNRRVQGDGADGLGMIPLEYQELTNSMDWFRGNFTGKPHI